MKRLVEGYFVGLVLMPNSYEELGGPELLLGEDHLVAGASRMKNLVSQVRRVGMSRRKSAFTARQR